MASTEEEHRLVQAQKVLFLKAMDYKKHLDEYNRQRIQNSTSPAA